MDYPTHWRKAYTAAFFIHLMVWLFFSLLLPHLKVAAEVPPPVVELEWNNYADDSGGETEEATTPEPMPPAEETIPTEQEVSTEEVELSQLDTAPTVANTIEEAVAQLDSRQGKLSQQADNIAIRGNSNGQTMGNPAKLLQEVQPTQGAISFRGRISVSAHIDRTGKVTTTKVMISSGNLVYDNIARNIVSKNWKFQPATDIKGEPMESNYICSLYFNIEHGRKN
jgi:periplasmic protein TonB